MDFGQSLLALRNEKGIYQKELAAYLNDSIGTVSNYENGVHSPDLETLCKLADFFGVSADYLLRRTQSRQGLDTLNRRLAPDYTVSGLVSSVLELTQRNVSSLLDFVELLKLRNERDRQAAGSRRKPGREHGGKSGGAASKKPETENDGKK
ncbi:MAG: helix-turn-helix domain-containing protein [Clostridium sp.]|jgi:transcriptional regulator with XRE-family HTH domain|nr:helix-turn-helix domain-containing protein [Clostridium sp.]